jgi:hypothetical protein
MALSTRSIFLVFLFSAACTHWQLSAIAQTSAASARLSRSSAVVLLPPIDVPAWLQKLPFSSERGGAC